MAAPLDRIRQALKTEPQRARFDRALSLLAAEIERITTSGDSCTPDFAPRFHEGNLVEVALTSKVTIS